MLKSLFCFFLVSFVSLNTYSTETTYIKSFDGYPIKHIIETPLGSDSNNIKRVVVFAHGSGPYDLNEDLSEMTIPEGTKNLFFKDISESLITKGFATVRYNKRSFEISEKIKANKDYVNSKEYKKYMLNPLSYTINDCNYFVNIAHKKFPKANIYILGHSEGTNIALYVAHKNTAVKGVPLIGFTSELVNVLVHDQMVWRYKDLFDELDKDRNAILDNTELGSDSPFAKTLLSQIKTVDLNNNGKIELSEFLAGQYTNVFSIRPNKESLIEAIKQPRIEDIIKEAKFKILFLQGEYDNQTPVYMTKGIQLMNNMFWKKGNLKFHYFEKAGHALDPRSDYTDINYRPISKDVLNTIAHDVDTFFN